MTFRRYLHYLRRASTMQPHKIIYKAGRMVWRKLKRTKKRLRVMLWGANISETDFQQALTIKHSPIKKFLTHIVTRQTPQFFIDPSRSNEFISGIQTHCPQVKIDTISAANRVCEHIFDLLGSGPIQLGEKIDWHTDFQMEHGWNPRQYYADITSAPYPGGYDLKMPWELSRCQHFAWLGQAYWFINDEKYTAEFMAQVLGWIEQNPLQFGVNWACAMDISIRAVNWLWGYHFFKDSPTLSDEFRLAFFKSMLAHGRHIMNNLEWSDVLTSNHYLSDIVGLVYLGILLPELAEAKQWREFGLQELENEMFKQVYPDGVDFEASISYHRLATELFISPIILCHLNDIPVSAKMMERLEKMIEYIMYYTMPDGTAPLIGDCDNGRLHRLKVWADTEKEQEWLDHRYLLAIGAVLFDRDDFGQAANNQWTEAFCLLGKQAVRFKERLDKKMPALKLKSRSFPDGGLYIMRDDELYMIVNAGSNGQNGNGGHSHNDTLSFQMQAYGQTFIVDPGSYIYTADFEARNLFRSTMYHNSIQIDRQEINPLEKYYLFKLADTAQPKASIRELSPDKLIMESMHSGYERLPQPINHYRQIIFNHRRKHWIIHDRFEGEGQHHFDFWLHFTDIQVTVHKEYPLVLQICGDKANLLIIPLPFSAPSGNNGLSLTLQKGQVSTSYGIRYNAPVACYSWEADVSLERKWLLLPYYSEQSINLAEIIDQQLYE